MFVCCKGAECSGSAEAQVSALFCVGRCPTTDQKTEEKFSDDLDVTLVENTDAFTGEYVESSDTSSDKSSDTSVTDTSSVPRGVTSVLFTLLAASAAAVGLL